MKWTPLNPSRLDLPCDFKHAISFPRTGKVYASETDRLTGGTGLYMNYSIIFTEISFYMETSILLQIIRIIYMTIRIIPEFDK